MTTAAGPAAEPALPGHRSAGSGYCALPWPGRRSGIDALTMRRLGQELGVEAMSLYNHVTNKDASPRRHRRPRGGRHRRPAGGDALEGGDAASGALGARRTAGAPLGGDARHVPLQHRARDDPLPRRHAGPTARGRLLGRRRARRLEHPRQPHLRLHAAGARPALRRRRDRQVSRTCSASCPRTNSLTSSR